MSLRVGRWLRADARALLFALLIGGSGAALQLTRDPLAGPDASLQDLVLAHRTPESYLGSAVNTPRDPRNFITIVAIDERTLAELGAYNGGYARSLHAQVIERLLAAPPRVIALDVGFFEPTADDADLSDAIAHAASLPVPTSVILSAAGLPQPDQSDGELRFDHGLEPVLGLARNARIALANVVPDDHGTIRGMPLVATLQGVERPSLGLAAFASYLRRPSFTDGRSADSIRIAGRSVPLDSSGFMRINFFGPPSRAYNSTSTFRVVSFVDVLRGRVDPAVWRGGLVFIGALGATGLADDYWTPTSDQGRKMAGVEIHANAASTLFSTNFLQVVPPFTSALLMLGLAMLLALLAAHAGPAMALLLAPLALVVFATASVAALFVEGWLTPLTLPMLVALTAFIAELVPRLAADQRQSRATRQALAAERMRDRLTGLGNREQLLAALAESIQSGAAFSLLLLDLDRFKDVNDALGHEAGDSLLLHVASCLVESLGEAATSVARLGGDEFAAVLRDTGTSEAVHARCVSILEALEAPAFVNEQPLSVAASIGVASFPEHGADAETLLRRADVAMYAAKNTHRGYMLYSADQEQRSAERLGLATALRQAILRNNDELTLLFQPKVSCQSGQLTGVEALVRWHHPEYGLLTPDRFIPLAEQTSMIGPLTRWVLEFAVRQASLWLHEPIEQPVEVAVNLSPHDLEGAWLPTYIAELLERHGVPPALLSLELTEGALLTDPDHALAVLADLAALGVEVSLDDFGTGYSSLSYLQRLPVRELKVDASFVRGVTTVERDRAIVRSTIELGHQLGLSIVAEGVEDGNTLRALTELGCDEVQGFHVSRPLSAENLANWIAERAGLQSRRADAA